MKITATPSTGDSASGITVTTTAFSTVTGMLGAVASPDGMLETREAKLTDCSALVTTAGAVVHMVLAVFVRLTFCGWVQTGGGEAGGIRRAWGGGRGQQPICQVIHIDC